MALRKEVVITGLGVVSPIGIGAEAYWQALCAGRSGVRTVPEFNRDDLPVHIGAPVDDFEPKSYIRPRKSLKIMSRDIQLGVAAAALAYEHAGLSPGVVDPERFGVVYGTDLIQLDPFELAPAFRACLVNEHFEFQNWGTRALAEMFPLWMLRQLPNMPACHVGIAHDARGPNNTITLGEVSGLVALAEAASVIERGWTDAMIAGGCYSRMTASQFIRSFNSQQSGRRENPQAASRPFDASRDGFVNGEGAAALLLESREHAETRGAMVLARLLGYGNAFEPHERDGRRTCSAIRRAIAGALRMAEVQPGAVGHVNAHGLSTTEDDRLEACAIRDTLGDVPVTALKSYFGNLGSGTGAVELAASVLSFAAGEVPPTRNYEQPDPECPVNVLHGAPLRGSAPVALKISHTTMGQAVAVLVAAP